MATKGQIRAWQRRVDEQRAIALREQGYSFEAIAYTLGWTVARVKTVVKGAKWVKDHR